LGAAVVFVLVVTVPLNWLLENYLLKAGALEWLNPAWKEIDLSFISFIMFIAVVASVVQLVEMIVEKFSPALYGALGIFLPLIAVNCSILGGALFMQERQYSTFLDVTAFSLGSGIGWAIAIILIAGIREKIRYSKIPDALKGLGITFIITGLMGLAFMSFSGIKYVDEVKKEKPKNSESSSSKTNELSTSKSSKQ
jgi:Na+-transporting NADH:ubiquinone oxidoreductase subunit E